MFSGLLSRAIRSMRDGTRGVGISPDPAGSDYQQIYVDSWDKLREHFDSGQFRSWAFRGQQDASWGLESKLSRYVKAAGVDPECWQKQEERILRIFRRKAHLFLSTIPDENDSLQWLALMAHHGAPTRLLDFTWSPYIAAFYALAQPPADREVAIWALYPPALDPYNRKYGPWTFDYYEKHFLPNQKSIVVIGEPHHMNQRLIAHSGTFVIPGRIDIPVEQIITEHVDARALVKLILKGDQKFRRSAIKALYSMNITPATLFPGLDGLARSMGFELELHWAFDPVTGAKYAREQT